MDFQPQRGRVWFKSQKSWSSKAQMHFSGTGNNETQGDGVNDGINDQSRRLWMKRWQGACILPFWLGAQKPQNFCPLTGEMGPWDNTLLSGISKVRQRKNSHFEQISDSLQRSFQFFISFNILVSLWARYDYSHFPEERNEFQRKGWHIQGHRTNLQPVLEFSFTSDCNMLGEVRCSLLLWRTDCQEANYDKSGYHAKIVPERTAICGIVVSVMCTCRVFMISYFKGTLCSFAAVSQPLYWLSLPSLVSVTE